MTSGTAAASWGDGRIDLFWTGPDDALVASGVRRGTVERHRVAGRDAGIGAGRDRMGGRRARGLRDPRRRPALEPLLGRPGVACLGEPRWTARSVGGPGRLVVERRPDRRLGARSRRADLAPLVGRHPLGRVGAAPALSRPRHVGDRRPRPSSSRHGPVVWLCHERHRHHPHHDDHLPRCQDRRRMACRAHTRAVPRPPPEGHRACLLRRPLGRAPARDLRLRRLRRGALHAPTPSSSRAPAGRASSRRRTRPRSRPRPIGRSS